MNLLFKVRRSLATITWTFIWCLLLCWLIVPVIYLIYRIIVVLNTTYEVYEDRVVTQTGIVNIHRNDMMLTDVLAVSTSQSFFGSICGYGTVRVNIVGRKDIVFNDIKNFHYVESHFRSLTINKNQIHQSIIEQ